MKGIFSTDISIAFFLAMLTLATCLAAFWLSASNYSVSAKESLKEKTAIEAADFVLKTCFPEGAAKCTDSLAYSHVLDERAKGIEFNPANASVRIVDSALHKQSAFCIRRAAVCEGKEVFVEACVGETA